MRGAVRLAVTQVDLALISPQGRGEAMAALRRMPAERRSVALALALSLLVKLLVPTGWMPTFDEHGIRLEMCGSYGAPSPAMQKAMLEVAHRMAGHAGEPDDHKKHDKTGADQPCAFAGLSWAALVSFVVPPAEGLLSARTAPTFALVATIGRGLAAPPPPSTGPPGLT